MSDDGLAIWSGIYESFSDAHDSRENHVSERWIQKSIERLRSIREGESVEFPSGLLSANPGAIIQAISSVTNRGIRPRVIDFGGNLGQLRFWLSDWLGLENLDWTVVERPDFLRNRAIRENLSTEIQFVADLQLSDPGCNILHFGSSIQYIEDLESSLGSFLRSREPEWVVIADAMVGENIPTFVTRQKYDLGYMVSKFRNMAELVSFFHDAGYKLFSAWGSLNEKNLHYYPERGLPAGYRILYPLDITFRLTPEQVSDV